MTISVSSPVTGSAQTGFTAPTYTLVTGTAPELNQKQWDVSALGGTQAGVVASSVSLPFTVTVSRPKVLKTLGTPNPVTGVVSNIPRNVYGALTRKGVQVMAGGVTPPVPMIIRTTIEVPAGADTVDPSNVRAALSLHIGTLSQVSAGIGDTTISGTF
jgi:hypothetical protein